MAANEKAVGVTSDHLLAERNRHVHHRARDVRRRAERRVPDDIQIGESGEAKGVAQAAAPGALDVEKQFRVAR